VAHQFVTIDPLKALWRTKANAFKAAELAPEPGNAPPNTGKDWADIFHGWIACPGPSMEKCPTSCVPFSRAFEPGLPCMHVSWTRADVEGNERLWKQRWITRWKSLWISLGISVGTTRPTTTNRGGILLHVYSE
jgi:hypothetical protein